MLADSPLAFLETLAQAAARPHADYRRRIAQAPTGGQLAQFVADPGGRLIGHAGGTVLPENPGTTVVQRLTVRPSGARDSSRHGRTAYAGAFVRPASDQ
jgi:hypothetical protein